VISRISSNRLDLEHSRFRLFLALNVRYWRKAKRTISIPARTQNAVRRYRTMDLSKLQLLQEALAKAEAHHAYIAVSTPSGTRILLRPDFTCYETYVEGTAPTDSC